MGPTPKGIFSVYSASQPPTSPGPHVTPHTSLIPADKDKPASVQPPQGDDLACSPYRLDRRLIVLIRKIKLKNKAIRITLVHVSLKALRDRCLSLGTSLGPTAHRDME